MQKSRPVVFIVDDEKTIAETLTAILRMSGFDGKSFTDPREALRAAQAETPDLLLSDVMMPQLTGIDLAIAVQRACPNCKVLLFSGQAETLDLLSEARKHGHYFHLLSKPIHPADLLKHIRSQDASWALGAA